MHLQYLSAFYYVSDHAAFQKDGQGFLGRVELNVISVGPVRLLTSMAVACCFRVLIWQPGVVKIVLEKWAVGGTTQAQTDIPLRNRYVKRRIY